MLQPSKKDDEAQRLNFYGPTLIKRDGAVAAEKVFNAWASLFSIGPKRIKLTGAYGRFEGETKEMGRYSTITVDRDEIVEKLEPWPITRNLSHAAMTSYFYCILVSNRKSISSSIIVTTTLDIFIDTDTPQE